LAGRGLQPVDAAGRLCDRVEERTGNMMPGNPRAAIVMAERRFPVRIRIGLRRRVSAVAMPI
jgi:hypothetical protein